MTNTIFKFLLCMSTFTIFNCTSTEPIKIKAFPVKNIPEHNFKMTISALHDTIASMFNFENQEKDTILNSIFFYYYPTDRKNLIHFSAETRDNTVFSKEYFLKPNTSNDIY